MRSLAGPKAEQKGTTHEGEDVSLEAHRERHREKEVVAAGRGGKRGPTRRRLRRERREWYNRDKQVIDAPQGPRCRCSLQTMAICFCLDEETHLPLRPPPPPPLLLPLRLLPLGRRHRRCLPTGPRSRLEVFSSRARFIPRRERRSPGPARQLNHIDR